MFKYELNLPKKYSNFLHLNFSKVTSVLKTSPYNKKISYIPKNYTQLLPVISGPPNLGKRFSKQIKFNSKNFKK